MTHGANPTYTLNNPYSLITKEQTESVMYICTELITYDAIHGTIYQCYRRRFTLASDAGDIYARF